MKKITASLAVIVLFFTLTIQASAQSFNDANSHWAAKEIQALVDAGVINGYDDGTFRPYTQVKRGQFVAFLVRALDLPPGDSAFKDVPRGSSLYKEIAAAKKAGLMEGTIDGYALANDPVTRSDVAVMLDRAMQLKGNYPTKAKLTYKDTADITRYAYESVQRMTHYGLIKGTADNEFLPKKIATRGESAVFVYRMMEKLDLFSGDKDPVDIPKPSDSSEVVVPVNDSQYIKVRMNTRGVPLTYDKYTTDGHIRSTDHHYYYHMGNASKPLGSLRVTLRKLDNGDVFVFTKFIHNGDNTYSASVIVPFQQSTDYSLAKYESFGKVDQSHDGTFGVDKTSHPVGILSAKKGNTVTNEMMMGKNYISLHRQKNYGNGQSSVLRELVNEYESYQIYTDAQRNLVTAHVNMSVKGKAISENWVLLSSKKLFADNTNRDDWFERTIKEYSSINNWLTADGAYTKLPWSIEPGYQMGYGRNIGRLQGGIYLTAYTGNKERYLQDLVLNAIADLDVFSGGAVTAGRTPIFKTEYTSTWLKGTYGTTAPYVDTRHNENAALFLKNASEILDIPQLAEANLRYADFLVQQKAIGNIIRVSPSSHLIADYYAPGSQKTHVSLNHALGEMRFLLETYKQTKNETYFKTARELKAGIENLHPRWIRTDRAGDLWYQVNGNFQFTGNDYDWLTLMDLLLGQIAFEENGLPRSTIFDKMIRSKAQYLVDNNIEIKSQIVLLLEQQGFGDIVKSASASAKARGQKLDLDELPKDELDLLAE
ncbi:S-layer homology domain-containing protein [Bacillus aerolatus]|uniref:S-layer homology domain-containing protein n=1 Tax=Bacillus aerolatus TaxID=2653354 RepID=A0A6I1FEY2_9BACI|nr:S-layer homology domain-containing protein [Bacillus aerolatus]KAB7706567.1 S-layer homology domain-containing protein [Bacillus aerolatus]